MPTAALGAIRPLRRPREVPNELWAMLVVVTMLVTVAVVTSTQDAADDELEYHCVAEAFISEQACADIYLSP